jgi:pyrroloquinoline quinone (PQQ) biosynthesis protein C
VSFFIRLLETTDANRRELEGLQKIQDMLNGKMTREEYKTFLINLYHIVWHLCPTMAAAASRCTDQFVDVRSHLYHSIDEEKGHEKMVLQDLSIFGVDAETVKGARPSNAVQAIIAYNYYVIERVHPCCVIGMLYAHELISSVYGGQLAASISLGFDMPLPHGFSYLDSHSAMDLDHIAELRELLQTINDATVQNLIIDAIQMNFYLFAAFLES